MRRAKIAAAAAAAAAALLTVSGCGVQPTTVNVFATGPIQVSATPTLNNQPTTTNGKYPYWVYLIKGDTTLPVKRFAASPPKLQDVLTSLLSEQPEQGYTTALTAHAASITDYLGDGNKQQQYTLDYQPFSQLETQERSQLVCTVWQWAQENRPANASGYNYSVEFFYPTNASPSGWHDCTEYTSVLPPGTKLPVSATAVSPRQANTFPAPSTAGSVVGG